MDFSLYCEAWTRVFDICGGRAVGVELSEAHPENHSVVFGVQRTKIADGFERVIINHLLPIREALRQNASATFDVEFQLSRSIDDVVDEGTQSEGDLITIAVFIVVGWLGLTSGACWRRPWRCVHRREPVDCGGCLNSCRCAGRTW